MNVSSDFLYELSGRSSFHRRCLTNYLGRLVREMKSLSDTGWSLIPRSSDNSTRLDFLVGNFLLLTARYSETGFLMMALDEFSRIDLKQLDSIVMPLFLKDFGPALYVEVGYQKLSKQSSHIELVALLARNLFLKNQNLIEAHTLKNREGHDANLARTLSG